MTDWANRIMDQLPAVLLRRKEFEDSGLPDRRNVPREKPVPVEESIFRYRTMTPAGPVPMAVKPEKLRRTRGAISEGVAGATV